MIEDLKPGKHLVMDNFSISDTFRLKRTIHKPEKDPSKPVLIADRQWENAVVTGTIIYDPEIKRWKMWYVAHNHQAEKLRKSMGKSKRRFAEKDGRSFCGCLEGKRRVWVKLAEGGLFFGC